MTNPGLPAITPAQIAALVTFAVTQAVAWGWITNDTGQRCVAIGGTLIAVAWKLADAYLRAQRVKAIAASPELAAHAASVAKST